MIPITIMTASKKDVKGRPMDYPKNAPLYYPKCSLVPISNDNESVKFTELPIDIKRKSKKTNSIVSYVIVLVIIIMVIVRMKG